jgi:hypothetical protein
MARFAKRQQQKLKRGVRIERPYVNQEPYAVLAAPLRRRYQGSDPPMRLRIHVGVELEQGSDALHVSVVRGRNERADAHPVFGVHARTVPHEQVDAPAEKLSSLR